ncbi:MAG TPA: serine/threonine-protein kinase [Candidatus Acidoferrum sp.]|nr:serine/threonine-protein kinase [Candidatus Acidoferrum sp.]
MSTALQAGRYEILETLGCGATSRVDKARDTLIGRTVAIKSFLQGFGRQNEKQFLREAQTIGRLSHSSIAQLYDVSCTSSASPFLIMEFVAGRSLEQLLTRSPIPFLTAAVWAADIASALSFAHREGIIHGDVKPGNIRVTKDDKVKLVDFGVARFASQVSGSDRVLGTPAYLSPEQIEGRKQDGRSDLFSLGIVLYEMVTGVRPFAGNSLGEVCAQILTVNPIPPSKVNPSVPVALDRILARCLARNPDDRYQSCNDLARALYLVARCGPHLAPQPNRPYWFMRPAHPRDLLAVASAILLLASAVIAAGSLYEWLYTRSTHASAAIPVRSSEGLVSTKHTRNFSTPQAPASLAIHPKKYVPTASARKPSPVTSAQREREVSAPAQLPVRSSLQ